MAALLIAVLAAILIVAVCIDVRSHMIPNELTFGAMIVGVALNAAAYGVSGIERSVMGLLIAAGVAGVFWITRMIGGGDHKLLMVVGAFVGMAHIIPVLVWTAFAGGIQALLWVIVMRFREYPRKPWKQVMRQTRMPYSIAIACGVAVMLVVDRLIASGLTPYLIR